MGLKIKTPTESKMLISKADSTDNDDNLNIDEEDLDESDSNEEANLLSDDSNIEESEEGSVHSSDDDDNDQNVKTMESKLMDNPAWADAMSKILKSNKPKRKKGIVLARAKKLNDTKKPAIPEEEKLSFEVVKNDQIEEDTEIKTEIKEDKDIKEEKPDPLASLTAAQRRLLKKVWQSKGRVKPSVLEKDREKALSKIATRGVITLFNAVRQQQNTLSEKLSAAGGTEVKRDKALKSINKKEFLDGLAERAKCENVDNPVKSESDSDTDVHNPVKSEDESDTDMPSSKTSKINGSSKPTKTWDVLRNNFMMGASMKDWDKEDDEGGEGSTLKKKQKKTVEKKESKSKSGGAKFSFSMDMEGDYEDEEDFGGSGDDGSEGEDDIEDGSGDGGSEGEDMEDGSSDFSD
uniref:RRP15-like protein n=2 Tax=Cacopsylla melanoneura TaxID=428564 RepID=A0A8D8RF59_9HEMI